MSHSHRRTRDALEHGTRDLQNSVKYEVSPTDASVQRTTLKTWLYSCSLLLTCYHLLSSSCRSENLSTVVSPFTLNINLRTTTVPLSNGTLHFEFLNCMSDVATLLGSLSIARCSCSVHSSALFSGSVHISWRTSMGSSIIS